MTVCDKCKSKNIRYSNAYNFHNFYACQDCNYWTYRQIEDCCKDPFKIIVIDRKNHDLYFIREQCLNCGGCINKAKPLPAKKFGDQIRGELSESREQEWWDNVHDEKQALVDLKKEYRYFNSPSFKYNEYRSTDTWKQKRKLVHERDNNICQICKQEKSTEIHHLTYKNIYNEKLEDLIAICHTCHKTVHIQPTSNEMNQGNSQPTSTTV